MEQTTRLKRRRVGIRPRAYLVYRALWPALEGAIRKAISECRCGAAAKALDILLGENCLGSQLLSLTTSNHSGGAVVTHDIPSPKIWGGVPARKLVNRAAA